MTRGGMSGGYIKYLRNVIPRMANNYDVEALLCVCPENLNVQDWFENLANVQFVNCRPFSFLRSRPKSRLEKHLERFSPDVLFVPLERHVRFKTVPTVCMVSNMWPLASDCKKYPFIEKAKFWARAIQTKVSVGKSDGVVAISNFVYDFLVKKWKVPAARVSLIYHGCESAATRDTRSDKRPQQIPESWNGMFLFTAGSIWPYRGLEDVLVAMRYLISQNIKIDGLVIAGKAEPTMTNYLKKLKDRVRKYNLSSKICWTGQLSQEEMGWCYNNCRIFIMSSRVESFGMIGVEAMSEGCICVVADNPCLPEIFGDAAVFYPPRRPEILAGKLQEVIDWPEARRQKMSKKAVRRAARFSWDKTVEQTVNKLMFVAGRNARQ